MQTIDINKRIYLVQYLPHTLINRLLTFFSIKKCTHIHQISCYASSSVGAVMELEIITLRPDITLNTAQRYLRRFNKIPRNTDKLFVILRDKTLLGEVTLQSILLNNGQCKISEIMQVKPITFLPEDHINKAAYIFKCKNLISVAVINSVGKILGRLTFDKIINLVFEKNNDSFNTKNKVNTKEDVYTPISEVLKIRWMWLAINFCTAFIASRVINSFEYTISKLVVLASLMPIVAGIGGNTGNQTITMIVRALALQNFHLSNFSILIKREMIIALISGLVWGSTMGGIIWWLYDDITLAGVMMMAMVFNLLVAAITGVIIPIMMNTLGHDPAVGSSVIITAVTDAGGFFIFLGLATVFLL